MNYAFLKSLLEQAEAYEAAGGVPDPSSFGQWLATREAAPTAAAAPAPPAYVLGMHVAYLYRYVKGYSRLALLGSPLSGTDDFAYLIAIAWEGPFTKSELIQRNIHEKATGTEVIRRLLDRGLVREEAHATDRRRKLLFVTDDGRRVLQQVLGRMDQVAQMARGNLSDADFYQLVTLLHKLDAFHNDRFRQGRAETFEALVAGWPVALPAGTVGE